MYLATIESGHRRLPAGKGVSEVSEPLISESSLKAVRERWPRKHPDQADILTDEFAIAIFLDRQRDLAVLEARIAVVDDIEGMLDSGGWEFVDKQDFEDYKANLQKQKAEREASTHVT
jgi:hypothetical protein